MGLGLGLGLGPRLGVGSDGDEHMHSGFLRQKATPSVMCPVKRPSTRATMHPDKLVQSILSCMVGTGLPARERERWIERAMTAVE